MIARFRWRCSYQGCVWFDVTENSGEQYQIVWRRVLERFEREMLNYPDEESKDRLVGATVGMIYREGAPTTPLSVALVTAFNDWRLAEWERQIAHMRAHPDRYGEILAEEPHFARPTPVGAIHLVSDGATSDPRYSWAVDVPCPGPLSKGGEAAAA